MVGLEELAYLRRKRDALCFIPGMEHSRPKDMIEKIEAVNTGNMCTAADKVCRKIFKLEDKF